MIAAAAPAAARVVGGPMHRRTRWGLGAGALLLYTLTCCPTVHWGDSGELISAGVVLGIAHPPGHPLFSIVAHLFRWLPVGGLAWRVNWMAACFGAVAVVLAFELAAETLRRFGAAAGRATACAAFAAAMFGLTSGLWSGSTVAETTTLHAAFMAALFWLVWRIAWVRPTGPTLTYALGAAAVLYGFSATNHVAGVFFLPALAILLIGSGGREVLHPKNVAVMFACVFAGLSMYAYLYLRSRQDPPLDWGNPETLRNLWWVMSARQFQAGLVQPTGAARAWTALAERGRMISGELTGVGTALAVLGVMRLARRFPWHAAFLFAALVPLIGLGLSSAFILAYFVPGLLLLAIGLAVGSMTVVERLARAPRLLAPAAGLALALWSGGQHYAASARQHARAAHLYAQSMLDAVPTGAVLFTTNMNMLFTTWALQAAEAYRTDVAVIDWSWVAGDSPLTEQMAQRHPDLHFPTRAELEPYRERWGAQEASVDLAFAAMVAENVGRRPLYVAVPGRPTEVSAHLAVLGPVFEMREQPGPYLDDARIAATRAYWEAWADRLDGDPSLREPSLTETLAYDLNNQGLFFERFGRLDLAAWNYEIAMRIAPERALPYLNRGRLEGTAGRWAAAAADYRTAVTIEPRNPRGHYYLGTALEALGDPDGAYSAYLDALFWDSRDGDANRRAGLLLLRAGQFGRVGEYLDAALRADPSDGAAARGLVRLALARQDYPAAARALRRANEIDGDSLHQLFLTAEYAAATGQVEMATQALAAAFVRDPKLTRALAAEADWARPLLPAAAAP